MTTNKRHIKIRFIDFWEGFTPQTLYLYKILAKHYDIELCDDADYVIYSTFGEEHWKLPDRCIKIFFTGECLSPDFGACDYAIGFDWIEFGDRYLHMPLYVIYADEQNENCLRKHILPTDWNLSKEKPSFCSFTVSNGINKLRNQMFIDLSKYKQVDSGGRFMNNIGGPVADKFEFDCKHKFTICFENGSFPGYTTEKLMQAFAARTIPIYWGDPLVGKYFNERAFINVSNFASLDEVISKIKEIDENDELYLKMLREPAYNPDAVCYTEMRNQLEHFLINIFEQPLNKAQRRNRVFYGREYVEKRIAREIAYQVDQRLLNSRHGRLLKKLIYFVTK